MFAFRLARTLGKTVRQLLAEVDSAELSEWMAFERIDPTPEPYWIGGMIAATVASYSSGKRHAPREFMPERRVPAADPAAEAAATKAHAFAWFGAIARARGQDAPPTPAS